MLRPITVAFLAAALLAGGCASERVTLPPGEDPDQLAAAIAAKGQTGGTNPAWDPDASHFLADHAETIAKVGQVCFCLPLLVAYGLGKSHSAGSPTPGSL